MSTHSATTFATSRRRTTTTPTTKQSLPTKPASLRLDSAKPTTFSSFEVELSSIDFDTATPTPSATATDNTVGPVITSSAAGVGATCTVDSDCTANTICTNRRCTNINDASPLGGLNAEPTSQLSKASAIGVGAGVVVLIALSIGLCLWCWRVRGRRSPKQSLEASSHNRTRSASNATDQKTLVASLPNSPHYAGFQQQAMPEAFFAKALVYDSGTEKAEYGRSGSVETSDHRSIATNKALPIRPLPEHPLPPPPTEPKRYAINVNIDKSMISDDELVLRAMSPMPNSGHSTPRERAPKYRFEEYLPPVARTPPISITRRPASSERSSEYELDRYPRSRKSSEISQTDRSDEEASQGSPRVKALTKLESKPPQLPPPELPPPSPSFSFRSYDWYQDIISDQPNGERTPTQGDFPKSPTPSQRVSRPDLHLMPEALSPIKPSALTLAHLHPNSAASPASPYYRLSPTVYTAPAKTPKLPPMPPQPPSPPSQSARVSILSTMTRQTHDSRSWLPDDGLYLPEEGTMDSYKRIRRPSDPSRPTSYSPLT